MYAIPMAIEESSVVAAASKSANFWLDRGGFKSEVIGMVKVGHVHFLWEGNEIEWMFDLFESHKNLFYDHTNDITKNMERPLRNDYLVSQNNFNAFLNGKKTDVPQLNLLDISFYKKVTPENENVFLKRLKSIILKNKITLSGRFNQNTLALLNRKLYQGILTHDKINLNNQWIPYLFPNHVKGIGESKLSLIDTIKNI